MKHYEMLADLLIYPENESFRRKAKDTYTYLLSTFPDAADAIKSFVEFAQTSSVKEMQELFLRSFDVQAITTLDMGFVLFGEDYKRGQLLVHLNSEHRKAGNNCGVELSDHLPNVLRLLPKMSARPDPSSGGKDEAMRNEIATRLVIPAIEKMLGEFSPEKIQKKDAVYKKHQKTILEYSQKYRTVYQSLLQATLIVLKKDFATVTPIDNLCSAEKDFKQNIETEMVIEKE